MSADLKFKKGIVIPFAFIALLIASLIIGWVLFNVYYGSRYESQVFEQSKIDTMRGEVEKAKGYFKQSLVYSSHQSLREHGCSGGLVGAGPWICNGPKVPSVSNSKECLEKYSKYYLNVYFGNYSIPELPVSLTKKNFSSLDYGVEPREVLTPPSTYDKYYDEGYLWVNATGAKLSLSSKQILETETVNVNTFLTKNRYWYLFRKFYEWASDDVYSPCVCKNADCACESNSKEEKCSSLCKEKSKKCGKKALEDLQKRFNKSIVKCHVTKPNECCAQGIGPISCSPKKKCKPWKNSICISNCNHECKDPPQPGDICSGSTSTSYSQLAAGITSDGLAENSYSTYENGDNENEDKEKCWVEARFATSHTFTCVDNKYRVPTENGPEPMRFKVSAFAFWKSPDRCYIGRCDYCTNKNQDD